MKLLLNTRLACFSFFILIANISFGQTWSAKTNFSGGARVAPGGFSIGSKGYTGMGYDGTMHNDFWEYDPVTNVWTQKANFGGAGRFGPSSFAIGNKGYVGLGSSAYPVYNFVTDFWEYDPAANTWTQKTPFPAAGRYTTTSFTIGNKGYTGTGWDGSHYRDFWEYDPAVNAWTQKADYGGTARQSAAGFSLNGKGYIGTGHDGANKNDFWEYNPGTNTWAPKANFPGAARFGSANFQIQGYGYIGTGGNGSVYYNDFFKYNDTTNTWSAVPAFGGAGVRHPVSFAIGDCGYVAAGVSASGNTSQFWALCSVCTVQADFSSPDSVCLNTPVNFINTSVGAVSYNWDFGDGSSDTNTTVSHLYLTPGTFEVKLVAANACGSDTQIATITVNPLPLIRASKDTAVCFGTAATLIASGGVSYLWSPATGLNTNTGSVVLSMPAATTVYTVLGTDSNNCSSSAAVIVNVNPLPLIQTGGNTQICTGSSANLIASGGVSYLWSPATGLNSTNSAQVIASPVSTTAYTVTGTDTNSCSSQAIVQVNVNPLPLIQVNGNTQVCAGSSTMLTASGAVSYLWSPVSGLDATTGSQVMATPLATTTYTVSGADSNNCSSSATVIIHLNPLPLIQSSGGALVCAGSSANLTASGGVTYVWDPVAGLSSGTGSQVVATPSSTTTYTVTGTDSSNCSASSTVTVSVSPMPAASVTPAGPLSLCGGNSATLQAPAGSGYSYEWYFNGGIIPGANTAQLTVSIAGNYHAAVTDSIGCLALSNTVTVLTGASGIQVTIATSPTAGCAPNTIYTGYGPSYILLTAVAPGAASYLWSTGETSQSIQVTSAGTYSVTAWDSSGCVSSATPQSEVTINVVDVRCGNNQNKVMLCHVAPGNSGNMQSLCISASAVDAHLNNHPGDCLGSCDQLRLPAMEGSVVSIYPNPFANTFKVHSENSVTLQLFIRDLTGRLVEFHVVSPGDSEFGEGLVNGIYLLEIVDGDHRQVLRVVKAN